MSNTTVLEPPVMNASASSRGRLDRFDQPTSVPDDLTIYRLSVEKYQAMATTGILDDGEPVELLEGLLVQKMTKNPPHSVATQLLQEALRPILPVGWRVSSQEPISLADSEPEPDLVIVFGGIRQYLDHHPGPKDIAMVVEVADATLRQDRHSKKRIYARAGIAVYWIVNLVENRIEVYTEPTGPSAQPDYGKRQDYAPSALIPVLIAGQTVGQLAVQELLP